MERSCKHCGQPFETNNPQKLYCNRDHYRPCPVCGTPVKMYDNDFSRRPACCSNICKHQLRQSKFKKKICVLCGDEFTPNSGSQTACNKVHYDNCEICNTPFVRTVANKIDGVTTCCHECTTKKLRRRSLEKYGTLYPMQSQVVQANFHQAMKQKYGVEHALQVPEIKQKQESTNLEQFGTIHACLSDPCIQGQMHHSTYSQVNHAFKSKLDQYEVDATPEFKDLSLFSYDFKINNTNILLEINPTYTHNTEGNHWNSKGLHPNYHRDKTQLAEDHGYKCIHVWDWDNADIIIQQLLPKTKLNVSEFQVYKLTKQATNKFLMENDIHGTCRGQLLSLGLIKDNQIYQVMTFGKSKYDKSYGIQLYRMCTRLGYEIDGGYDVLSQSASREFGVDSCITYVDRSKLYNDECEMMGMTLKRLTPPQEIWSKGNQKITANLLRARGYDQLFGTDYGKGTSNEELMLQNGWLPVYDCGMRVYVV